jgi:hypothetical protein
LEKFNSGDGHWQSFAALNLADEGAPENLRHGEISGIEFDTLRQVASTPES